MLTKSACLDINREVDDFRRTLACGWAAGAVGVAMIPGAGYGALTRCRRLAPTSPLPCPTGAFRSSSHDDENVSARYR